MIPRLEPEDREAILPLIVKLLQSKLLQKRGAINKKSLLTRRNIVYNLYATFNTESELPLVINELLEPLNLTIETCDSNALIEGLSRASFEGYLSFIYAFEVLLKQMGSLLISFLPKLTKVLIKGVMSLSKLF